MSTKSLVGILMAFISLGSTNPASELRPDKDFLGWLVEYSGLESGPGTKEEKEALAKRLVEEVLTSMPRKELVRQCGLAMGARNRDAAVRFNPLMVGFLFELLGITDKEIVESFIPLWRDGDPPLRDAMESGMGGIGSRPTEDYFFGYDFAVFLQVLDEGSCDKAAIIDFMFTESPASALVTFLRRDAVAEAEIASLKSRITPILEASSKLARPEQISKGIEALQDLSTSENHWVQCYVAEIYRSVPAIRTPAVETILKQNKDPFIQSRINAIAAESVPATEPLKSEP